MRYAYADPARDPSRQRDIPQQPACAGGEPMSAEMVSRRAVLAGAGVLVVSFSLLPRDLLAQAPGGPKPPGSLEKSPMLDAWIRIDPDGKITIFTGKAELGQGIKTALVQLAAEELVVMPEAIHLVTADTALTPDEGYTAGSHSMQDSGMAIRHAAAQAREVLIGAAASRWQLPPERLQAKDGAVVADDRRRAGYGELVSGELLHVRAEPDVKPVAPTQHRIVGRSLARVDIPAKVAGGEAYVQDLRFADMVHGRVVRPPSYGAKLRGIDLGAVRNVAGLLKVYWDGSYLAVIAESEYQAIAAARALSTVSQWEERSTLPEPAELFDWLAAQPSQRVPVRDDLGEMPSGMRIVEASYRREYQMHAWHRAQPIEQPAPKPLPLPEGGGHRNAVPLYTIPNARVLYDFIPVMPVRVSALRSLGAYMNVFSIESFIDELAQAAQADPVEFRLRHLDDARAREVVSTATDRFGWAQYKREKGRGRGFAFARYKNLAAYMALAVEIELERESGRVRLKRAVAAVDSGEAVNPDGIKNQIEGGILQSASWTLYESVAFDRTRVTSRDWGSYPILRFSAVPDEIEVHVIDRPGMPFLGTGEASQGPTAAAIANAIADATGVRLRDIPLTATRVKAAIGV